MALLFMINGRSISLHTATAIIIEIAPREAPMRVSMLEGYIPPGTIPGARITKMISVISATATTGNLM
ncbi:hypothetical protein AN916_09020 [Mycobacteroides immunogenum]|nr:hypothetical protein AN916_09020 [Mycobacteroides immunogenum]